MAVMLKTTFSNTFDENVLILTGWLCNMVDKILWIWKHSWWRHQKGTFSASLALCAGIHRSSVNSPHKGQWRGTLMFSLICLWIKGWVNNHEAGELRRHGAYYDVIVVLIRKALQALCEVDSPHIWPRQTAEQTEDLPVIWNTMMFTGRHRNILERRQYLTRIIKVLLKFVWFCLVVTHYVSLSSCNNQSRFAINCLWLHWGWVGVSGLHGISSRADSRLALSQWETSVQSNAVSHWLDASLESALNSHHIEAWTNGWGLCRHFQGLLFNDRIWILNTTQREL